MSQEGYRGFEPTVRNVSMEDVTCQKSNYGVLIIGGNKVENVYDIHVKNCKFDGVIKQPTKVRKQDKKREVRQPHHQWFTGSQQGRPSLPDLLRVAHPQRDAARASVLPARLQQEAKVELRNGH